MEILIPVIIMGLLGLLFGIGLAFASKRFVVEVDPRLERIHGLLPGANCGACGGAGCFGFAEDVLSGKLSIDACRVSEEVVKEQIARLLGKSIEKKVKLAAILHCYGGKKVKDRFIYKGIETCVALNQVFGGQKACIYGCLGFGDCVRVCPFDAIKMSDECIPVIDENKCKACNKCVLLCPKKLFSLRQVMYKVYPALPKEEQDIERKSGVYVACSSRDSGRNTRVVCPLGCIACKRCEQVCPVDAIHVADNLAVIDYKKCTSCGKCVDICPTKTIRKHLVL